ncbi:MAG: transposase [Proteobacteria bacterium]|nr:transposase [Pseudomonadota bacterium]
MKHKHLYHIDLDNHYQFITFRTFDSIDDYLRKLYASDCPNRVKQQQVDNYLDQSTKGAYLNNEVLAYLKTFIESKHTDLYDLSAYCIMPNHVHLLIKPHFKLSLIMQKIKGASANKINKILGSKGQFWARGYFDKLIREEKHFAVVYAYIKNNPLKLNESSLLIDRFYGVYDE